MNINQVVLRPVGGPDQPQIPELQQGADDRIQHVAHRVIPFPTMLFNGLFAGVICATWILVGIRVFQDDSQVKDKSEDLISTATLITFVASICACVLNISRHTEGALWLLPLLGSWCYLFPLEDQQELPSPILEMNIGYSLLPPHNYMYISGTIGNLHLVASERDSLFRIETAKYLLDRFPQSDGCLDSFPLNCHLERMVSFFPHNLDDIMRKALPLYPRNQKPDLKQLEMKQRHSLVLARDLRDTRFNHFMHNNISIANPDFLPAISKETYEQIDAEILTWTLPHDKRVVNELFATVWKFVGDLLKDRHIESREKLKTQKKLFGFRTFHIQNERHVIQLLELRIASILRTKNMLYVRSVTKGVLQFLYNTNNLVYFHHDQKLGFHIVC